MQEVPKSCELIQIVRPNKKDMSGSGYSQKKIWVGR